MERSGSELGLPGFRFHPTEEELLDFYLTQMARRKKLHFDVIGTLNIYCHDPWELPRLARIGEREWYFFVPRDGRRSSGGRPNRTTQRGFWKATGSDRAIRSATDPKRLIGLKKTLVFYMGRAPRGSKTDWVMNEYRLPGSSSTIPPPQEDMVLCKVYRKATPLKELEQRAAMQEEARASPGASTSFADAASPSNLDYSRQISSDLNIEDYNFQISNDLNVENEIDGLLSKEDDQIRREKETSAESQPVDFQELKVPNVYEMDWMQDPSMTQPTNPWMEQLSPLYGNAFSF